jgi:hypothetical protein
MNPRREIVIHAVVIVKITAKISVGKAEEVQQPALGTNPRGMRRIKYKTINLSKVIVCAVVRPVTGFLIAP